MTPNGTSGLYEILISKQKYIFKYKLLECCFILQKKENFENCSESVQNGINFEHLPSTHK